MMSSHKTSVKKSVDATQDGDGGGGNDDDGEKGKTTFATIYPVGLRSDVQLFDKPEVGEVALKDGFVFQKSEAVTNAEGKKDCVKDGPFLA